MTIDRSRCYATDFRNFVNGHAAKETQFGDLSPEAIELCQPIQSVVEGQELYRMLNSYGHRVFQGNRKVIPAAFFGVRGTGVIDQDPAHHLCSHAKEMSPVLQIPLALLDKPQPGFMHQGGGLQSMVRALPAHVTTGKTPEFVIDQCDELIGRTLFAGLELVQQQRDFTLRGSHKLNDTRYDL
jgi:hypothetical protein